MWVALYARLDESRPRLFRQILKGLPFSDWQSSPVLPQLVPYLSEADFDAVAQLVVAVDDSGVRARLLDQLAPGLPPRLLRQVVEQAEALRDTEAQSEMLFAFVRPLLDSTHWDDALAAARAIPDDWRRSAALVSVARGTVETIQSEALTAARRVPLDVYRYRGTNPAESAGTALANAGRLFEEPERRHLLEEALRASREDSLLASICPYLAEYGYADWALDVTESIGNVGWQATALAWTAQNVEGHALERVLDLVEVLPAEYRTGILIQVSADLPSHLLERAVSVAHSIDSDADRVTALAALFPRLPTPLKSETLQCALTLVGRIERPSARVRASAALSGALEPPAKAAILGAALELCRTMDDDGERAAAVSQLTTACWTSGCSRTPPRWPARSSDASHWRDVMLVAVATRLARTGACRSRDGRDW